MKCMISGVDDHGVHYDVLMFVCPGCIDMNGSSGLHMLPVTGEGRPTWSFDGNLEAPTLSPSILTGKNSPNICHSFLKAGIFEFLGDCTHSLAGKHVPMPDLPDWAID